MHGIVTLQVVAVSKDGVSSTTSSSPTSFTVNISPVADTPTVSVPDSSTAINIVENTELIIHHQLSMGFL